MKALHWSSPRQTRAWVKSFAKELKRPCVVLLSGPLGAGKTQLVKWFLQEMNVQNAVSPTFAIHQRYESRSGPVDHVDLYRLQSDKDLESSGFWDLLSEAQGLLFVEWAERLPETVWPLAWKKIFIKLDFEGEMRRAEVKIVDK